MRSLVRLYRRHVFTLAAIAAGILLGLAMAAPVIYY